MTEIVPDLPLRLDDIDDKDRALSSLRGVEHRHLLVWADQREGEE